MWPFDSNVSFIPTFEYRCSWMFAEPEEVLAEIFLEDESNASMFGGIN